MNRRNQLTALKRPKKTTLRMRGKLCIVETSSDKTSLRGVTQVNGLFPEYQFLQCLTNSLFTGKREAQRASLAFQGC